VISSANTHHVALPAEMMRALLNVMRYFALPVSYRRRLTYSLFHDASDLVVFCFAKPEDADAFARRFGGERLPETRR
jgi:hypothetical protein